MQGHLLVVISWNTRIIQILQYKGITLLFPEDYDECVLDYVRTRSVHHCIKHLRRSFNDQLKEINDDVTSISASLQNGKAFPVLDQLSSMPRLFQKKANIASMV
jgi:hypothetical protein